MPLQNSKDEFLSSIRVWAKISAPTSFTIILLPRSHPTRHLQYMPTFGALQRYMGGSAQTEPHLAPNQERNEQERQLTDNIDKIRTQLAERTRELL